MAKLDQEPRLPGESPALVEWARRVAQLLNLHDDLKAPIDSPAFTGNPTAPTQANSDNSTRIATTAWVRSAMATIASAAGFVVLLSAIGYIKLPSWLGGVVIQWGNASTSASAEVAVTFPLAFPTGPAVVFGNVPSTVVGWTANPNSITASGMSIGAWAGGSTRQTAFCYWLAIGY